MGRPREFDEDAVLSALQDVFWEHGYEGASYADIMAATGLKKGSLYSAFGDKRALYLHALAQYDTQHVGEGVKMLRDDSRPATARIGDLMQALVEAAETPRGRWGCLLCNAAVDQAPFDSGTETVVKASLGRMREALAHALGGTDAADKVELVWSAYFGGRVLVKSGADKTTLEILKSQTLSLL